MKNKVELTVEEMLIINNIIMMSNNGRNKIKDIRLIKMCTDKLLKQIGQSPKPKEELSNKEEDKEENEKKIKAYEKELDKWSSQIKKIELSDTELNTIKSRLNEYENYSNDPKEMDIVYSISNKLGIK